MTWKRARGLGHLGDLWSGTLVTWKGSGKTLCEILTAADAMSLSMAGPRIDGNLSRHISARPSLQRSGSRTWSRLPRRGCHAIPMQAVLVQKPCHPHASRSGPKTMPSGHATTLSKGIHTPVICHSSANSAPIASLPGYRNPTVCILLKKTAQDRAV